MSGYEVVSGGPVEVPVASQGSVDAFHPPAGGIRGAYPLTGWLPAGAWLPVCPALTGA
jgi:hypothetical protein